MTSNTVQSRVHTVARELPEGRALLELLKPVTWFPPMWAFACGAVSSGVGVEGQWLRIALGVLVAGPLVCAASQAVNDWYDREVDAINEPNRPIPSGRVPGRWGLAMAVGWTALSAATAWFLGLWGWLATLAALAMAWAYSAPPLRLKRNGWAGNAAVAFSYESLAWITGAAVLLGGRWPGADVFVFALLYGAGAHGIMVLNDFKAVEGDRRIGIRSLPAVLGRETAARVACWTMAGAQVAVIVLLWSGGRELYAGGVLLLLAIQVPLMARFLRSPEDRDVWYSAVGVPVYVSGMMVTAFALRAGWGL